MAERGQGAKVLKKSAPRSLTMAMIGENSQASSESLPLARRTP